MIYIFSIPTLRNIILSVLLSITASSTIGQSLKGTRIQKDGWIFQFTAEKQSHQIVINYTSPTGETLSMNKDYSNPNAMVKSYIFNEGQAAVMIKGNTGGFSINTGLPVNATYGSQTIDYGSYQPLMDEYRLTLSEVQASMGELPFETINNISKFYDCDEASHNRSGVLECAAAFFAYTSTAILEEITCVSGLTPPCQAAISAALSSFTAMISICSNVENDGDGDGDPGNGGGSDGGGDAGSGSVAIVYYGGSTGSGGGPDCSWACDGEYNCTLTCYLQ